MVRHRGVPLQQNVTNKIQFKYKPLFLHSAQGYTACRRSRGVRRMCVTTMSLRRPRTASCNKTARTWRASARADDRLKCRYELLKVTENPRRRHRRHSSLESKHYHHHANLVMHLTLLCTRVTPFFCHHRVSCRLLTAFQNKTRLLVVVRVVVRPVRNFRRPRRIPGANAYWRVCFCVLRVSKPDRLFSR